MNQNGQCPARAEACRVFVSNVLFNETSCKSILVRNYSKYSEKGIFLCRACKKRKANYGLQLIGPFGKDFDIWGSTALLLDCNLLQIQSERLHVSALYSGSCSLLHFEGRRNSRSFQNSILSRDSHTFTIYLTRITFKFQELRKVRDDEQRKEGTLGDLKKGWKMP